MVKRCRASHYPVILTSQPSIATRDTMATTSACLHYPSPPPSASLTKTFLHPPPATYSGMNNGGGTPLDEFEEFRARANSGGLSPEVRRQLIARKLAIEADAGRDTSSQPLHSPASQQQYPPTLEDSDDDNDCNESEDFIDAYFASNKQQSLANNNNTSNAPTRSSAVSTAIDEEAEAASQPAAAARGGDHARQQQQVVNQRVTGILEWRRLRTEGSSSSSYGTDSPVDWVSMDAMRPRTQSMPVRASILRPLNRSRQQQAHQQQQQHRSTTTSNEPVGDGNSSSTSNGCSGSGYHVLRSFTIGKKGLLKEDLVVNCGSSSLYCSSASQTHRESGYFSQSTASYVENCSTAPAMMHAGGRMGHREACESLSHSSYSHGWQVENRVELLGAARVGKSALVKRFTRPPALDLFPLPGTSLSLLCLFSVNRLL